jgi:ATP-binding cassette, subfamily B, bacterial
VTTGLRRHLRRATVVLTVTIVIFASFSSAAVAAAMNTPSVSPPLSAVSAEAGSEEQAEQLAAFASLLALAAALFVFFRVRSRARRTMVEPKRSSRSDRVYGDLVLYRRLLREARPCWPHIGGIFVLGLLATPIALLTPLGLKIAVDSGLGSDPLPSFLDPIAPDAGSTMAILVFAAGLMVAVALLDQVQQVGTSVLGTYAGENLQLAFRARLFRHAQALSLSYHDKRGSADAVYRIQYDAPSIQWIAIYGLTPFVSAGLMVVGMIYVTARIDWELALVALTVAPAIAVLTWLSRRPLRTGWRATKELESSALSVVQEVLGGLRVVKAFGQEDREQARFLHWSGAGLRARIRLAIVQGSFAALVGITIAGGTATVLFVGARNVQEGTLTLGELLLVMGYLVQLYVPMQTISKSIATLQSSLASAERAFSILDEAPDVRERPHAFPLGRARGHIEFRDVSFAYEQGTPVISGVSFDIDAGKSVGISGTTGAGKTTLVNLLTRFYDPTSGEILLDGVNVRYYALADLRNQFAIVLQEPVLFSTTIAENIGYARPDSRRDEIEAAARSANAHHFIEALPEGYDTVVGERGMRLSGGERQRVALARAFLKDAPILILDEPTSSVDVRTEAAIMEAMERLMHGRTTIMIAHRLSTLERCDARLEVNSGRVIDIRDLAERRQGATAVPLRSRTATEQ